MQKKRRTAGCMNVHAARGFLRRNYLVVPELEVPPVLPDELDEPPAAPGVLPELEPPEPDVPELPPDVLEPGVLEELPGVLAPGVLDELAPPVLPDVPELPGALEELPGVLEEPAPAAPGAEVSPPEVLPAAPVLGVLDVEPDPVVPAAPEEVEELGALLGVLELEELGVLPLVLLLSSDFFPQPANSRANALAARTSLDAFIVDFIMSFLSIKLIGC